MKSLLFFLAFVGFHLTANQLLAQESSSPEMIPIGVYGKAGVTISPDGSYKICPGFSFYKCATVYISIRDVWNYLFKSNAPNVPVTVEIYNEQQQIEDVLLMKMGIVQPDKFDSEEMLHNLTEDDLILK